MGIQASFFRLALFSQETPGGVDFQKIGLILGLAILWGFQSD
jgi:hypothetical protein